jgi:hypothetical protein
LDLTLPKTSIKDQVEKVEDVFRNDNTLKPSDVRKGKGFDAVPWLLNPTLINVGKIFNYKKQVIQEKYIGRKGIFACFDIEESLINKHMEQFNGKRIDNIQLLSLVQDYNRQLIIRKSYFHFAKVILCS